MPQTRRRSLHAGYLARARRGAVGGCSPPPRQPAERNAEGERPPAVSTASALPVPYGRQSRRNLSDRPRPLGRRRVLP